MFLDKTVIIAFLLFLAPNAFGQDEEKIEAVCLNYIEGFYEGDTLKLKLALKPTLTKYGFWKNEETGGFEPRGYLPYREALDLAEKIRKNKRFATEDDPKLIEILDVGQHIACAKVTARWGIDYILLSRQVDGWIIEQVLWEGPLVK